MANEFVIVLPTYQEAENLTTLLPAILENSTASVLLVDDDSRDGSAEIAEQIGGQTGRVAVLRRSGKMGLGSAYRAGMRRALDEGAAYVGTMDADWSHDPLRLSALFETARSGADLAIGSRYTTGGGISQWPLWRRCLSKSARGAARFLLGPICQDFTSGYRVYRRHALELVPPESIVSDSYSFLMETAVRIHRENLTIREVPINFVDRRRGASKMPIAEIFRAVRTLLRLRKL